jgi:diguanylate cyclase (GGDEF)-like protein
MLVVEAKMYPPRSSDDVPARESDTAPTSVLLVDDRVENLIALEASIEPLGTRIVCARSGLDALRAVLDEQFAVILMDVKMPGLDGIETMKLLKERERSRNTPIIFLSASGETENVWRSYASGAVDYLHKPVDPKALRAKVSVFVALHEKELALQAAHAELERRVAERTEELAAANLALHHEVAERKAAEARLYDLAHRDPLTGFANRGLLLQEINRAVARATRLAAPFAVMLIDIDRFKSVNDSLGHLAGDRLLLGIANRLTSCLREVDVPGRLGGDEFAVLLDGVASAEDALRAAERVQAVLASPFVVFGKEVFATASIGTALMTPRYTRGEELLRDADVAMYRAKQSGRARSQLFDCEMDTRVRAKVRLEAQLARALERDQLALHYQPIIDTRTNHVTGFEALVRWQHPEQGMLGPSLFIPIAEDTGLIRSIGQWVLETACRQLQQWSRTNPALTMSVNLSAYQLAHPDLVSSVLGAIEATSIAPRQLNLEITESAVMPNIGLAEGSLTRLRDVGVDISLDDFGTGYSCLSHLHDLPVTAVKIDRSFVQRLCTPNQRPVVVQAIIGLAHTLGMSVTAEGVETEEQLDFLRQLGCERAQGFLFATPLDVASASRFVTAPDRE